MDSGAVARAWERRVFKPPQLQVVQERGSNTQASCNRIKNVGTVERLASLAGGAALALAGRQKGSWGGLLLAAGGIGLLYRGVTGYCHSYQSLGISTANHPANTVIPARQGIKVEKRLFVNRPVADLYRFWRDLANLPRAFEHLKSVERRDGNVSHWITAGPANTTVEWDAEIFNDHENELIAWRSLEGSQIDTAGSVRFEPARGDQGTVVAISLKYNPPGGKITDYVASWFGCDLESRLQNDLRRFKSLLEAGEIPTTEGQPQGPS